MVDFPVLYTPAGTGKLQGFRNTVNAVAEVDALGSVLVDQFGVPIGTRADGFLRTQIDPTTLIFDTFETLDTTNTWTVGGTVVPTGATGVLTLAAGTAANATSFATSKPAFTPGNNAYLVFGALVTISAAAVTGNQRFWGLGVYTTPTMALPVTNGCIFEVDNTTGDLRASVYSAGARTQSTVITRPTDGNVHRYNILYRASRVYFDLDSVIVASFPFPNPSVSALATVIGSVNGGTVLGANATLTSTLIGVGDTGRNATKLADGNFPWRTAAFTAKGAQGGFGLATQDLKDSGRAIVNAAAGSAGIATVTTEALVALNVSRDGATTASATTLAASSGKRLRVVGVMLSIRGTAASILSVRVSLRLNPAAAVAVTSPLITTVALATTAALAEAGDKIFLPLPDGFEISGTMNIGLSHIGNLATGFLFASIIAFEY